jgi:5-methylcytosine-specific restriction endonuclease McrA
LYIQSDEWKAKARKIIERDGGKCVCSSTEKLQVHHKKGSYSRLGQELDSDLVTLCNDCHVYVTNKNRSEKAEMKFNQASQAEELKKKVS